jgi:NAD(P)-dependent dehydrogenase (short-subunit alcohol dehydrogenase family)
LDPFVYLSLPLRVVFGEGTSARLAEEADLLAVRGALVLTTPSHERLGLEMAERLGDRFAGLFVGAVMHTPVGVTEEAIKGGRFVGHSSSFPGVAAYAASKSGLIGLTQTLAAEFGPHNIRVNAILSGAVDTDMYREMNDTPDKTAFITNLHALKRVGRPEEVARSVLYLASDDSAFVTGTALLIDGGLSITRT